MSSTFTNALTIMVALAFLAISLGLIYIAVRQALDHGQQMNRRLAGGAGHDAPELGVKQKRRLLAKLGSHLSLPDAKKITRIRFQLAQAGYYDDTAVKSFYGARVISLLGPQLLMLLFWGVIWAKIGATWTMTLAAVLIIIGLTAPSWFIRWKQSKRTLQCKNGFPDMMDLMVACIEAGLGLDAALIRVSHELGGRYPALKVNMEIMNLELRAGRERHESMMNFADRINLDEAKALAVMLKQSEEMGASMGTALRTFSEDMRSRRMLKAEEKAMALSAKLTVPLILFIFPTLMVMLLLPAGLRIAQGLSGT